MIHIQLAIQNHIQSNGYKVQPTNFEDHVAIIYKDRILAVIQQFSDYIEINGQWAYRGGNITISHNDPELLIKIIKFFQDQMA